MSCPRLDWNNPFHPHTLINICLEIECPGRHPHWTFRCLAYIHRVLWPNYKHLAEEMVILVGER